MTELILERNERLRLRADAHHLNPLVLIGEKGMTPAVLKEIERALDDHGLVKVHVAGDDREERDEIYHTVADELGAARIQEIGKMLVFYRPPVEKSEEDIGLEQLRAKSDPGARGIKKPADKKRSSLWANPPAPRTPSARAKHVQQPSAKPRRPRLPDELQIFVSKPAERPNRRLFCECD